MVPEKNSDEKLDTLLALGAEVIQTPDVPFDSPDSDINVAKNLAKTTKGGVMLDQVSDHNQ